MRDHDHLTGEYPGAAHNECNLNFKYAKENEKKKLSYDIPIVFHNLRGYDGHIIMSTIGLSRTKNSLAYQITWRNIFPFQWAI